MEVARYALRLPDPSSVGEARRTATGLAGRAGLDVESSGRVALVTTELATNAVKHARDGWCFLSPIPGAEPLVHVLVVDSGEGIADTAAALRDGYSTSGTAGTGLGAARRASVGFDLYTQTGRGTVVTAVVGPNPEHRPGLDPHQTRVRGVVAPKQGEEVSGDTWALARTPRGIGLLVADGLGHGPEAAKAAAEAARVFERDREWDAAERLDSIHFALTSTRGAATAVALLDHDRREVTFAGIGNISARIVSARGTQGLVSMNGTAGLHASPAREFRYAAPPGALLVLHSDGISARWDLATYAGLMKRDPGIIAGVLFRDFARGTDDAAVVVARIGGRGEEE